MSPRAIRVTLVLALGCSIAGAGLAATVSRRAGGALLLAGWVSAIGALHALGRASALPR